MVRTIAAMLAALIGLQAPAALARAQAQTAGTLVSAEPVASPPGGMQAWRIRYTTRSQNGASAVVTGMVVAPRGGIPANPRKVIAWTHGTWGVAEQCAPSLAANFYAATPALAEMVQRGYVVVAPDYPGLGSAMPHGFLVGDDAARSVLDAVRAAQAIPGAAAGRSFAVWGESQGGHAALWTAIDARGYAPELQLVGTAAAAPPTALADNLRQSADPNVRTMMIAYLSYSWSQRFGVSLTSLYNRQNAGVVSRLARNNCVSLESKPRLGTMLGVVAVRTALRGKDLGTIQPWARLAAANSVTAARVPGPVLIAQSDSDTLVAPAVTLDFARRMCRSGRRVKYIRMSDVPHPQSARQSATETLDWIDARFAGAPAPTSCGSL